MPEPPRPAVEEDQHLPRAHVQPEGARRLLVVDLLDRLYLQEVVARAQRAELLAAPLPRPLADRVRVRSGDAAARLRGVEVGGGAIPALDRPGGALCHHLVQLAVADAERAVGAQAGRHVLEEPVGELPDDRPDLVLPQAGADETGAAVDVEADAAGRDDAVVETHRRHAADREAVPPVDVGHRQRVADDPRQEGDVGDLLDSLVLRHRPQHALIGEDEAGDAHAALVAHRQPPAVLVDLLQHVEPALAHRKSP